MNNYVGRFYCVSLKYRLIGLIAILTSLFLGPQAGAQSTGTPYITSTSLGTLRDNYSGWVGMAIATGANPVVVNSLGRIVAPGNTAPHVVKLVNGMTGADVPGGSVTVPTAGGQVGQFSYVSLAAPVSLAANATYYLVTQETYGGDLWYDYNTTVQTANVAAAFAAVYGEGPWTTIGSTGQTYGPVDFQYGAVASGPATITQQPQNATVVVGQFATFSVTAISGTPPTYQWQSQPAGASSFSDISGATSSTYSTAPTQASDNGTQFLCIVTNNSGPVSSSAATLTVQQTNTGVSFVTSAALGTLRSDYSGWVGMAIQTAANPVVVTALGRIVVSGNTASHIVKLVNGATGADVSGGSIAVPTTGALPGSFSYANLASPVTLGANSTYFLVSQEASGGDQWYDDNTTVQTANVARDFAAVYGSGSPYTTLGTAGHTYVPVSFQFSSPSGALPAITQQPQNATVTAEQFATFSVTATSSTPVTYQWQSQPSGASGFTNIPGATFSAFSTPVTQASDNGAQFLCIVTNSLGSVSSTTAALTVQQPSPGTPVITQQPSSSNVYLGQTATFSVVATGENLTYQWQSNQSGAFTNIPGATSAFYTPPPATPNGGIFRDGGYFGGFQLLCLVTNSQGTTQSATAVFGVSTSPLQQYFILTRTPGTILRNDVSGWVAMSVSILQQPMVVSYLGRLVAPGNTGTHTLKIVTADGTDVPGASVTVSTAGVPVGTFVYGTFATPITLSPNTTYQFVSQEFAGGDQWYDEVGGETTGETPVGDAAQVGDSVLNTPAPGTPSEAFDFIYTVPTTVTVTPSTVTLFGGQTQTFSATVNGLNIGEIVSSTWTINPTGVGSVLIEDQSGQSGYQVGQLELLYSAPASISTSQPITLTITSVADPTKSASATITLSTAEPPVPILTTQPQNTTVTVGQPATFSVAVTSSTPVTYQWQSGLIGFSNIPGATSSTYTTPPTQTSQSGMQFICVVTNSTGSVYSNTVTLTVQNPAPPPPPPPTPTAYVLSTALGTLRNNYSGWIGASITVNSAPLTVSALGRIFAPGNSQSHTVKIVNASTGADVPGGSASISMSGGTAGTFVYGNLSSPVVLSAFGTYYVLTQETAGGDQWYDSNTTAQSNSVAALNGGVYGSAAPFVAPAGSPGHLYGPVDFQYDPPATVSATNFVTTYVLGTARNNFSGRVGMTINVGAAALTVSQLGRMVAPGNSGSHTVKLVNSLGVDVAGGSVTVNTAGATTGSFTYGMLSAPVTLNANTTYYLVSQETAGGDQWYDLNTTVQSLNVASIGNVIYSSGSSYLFVAGTNGHAYGPLDFRFQ